MTPHQVEDEVRGAPDQLDSVLENAVQATGERMAELTDKLNGLIGYVEGMQPPSKS